MHLIADTHTHSKYSVDSTEQIEELCLSAIDRGIKVLCVTDHVDYNPKDYGYNYYMKEAYFYELLRMKKKYQNDLLLLSGIEFSEPHLYPDELKKYQDLNYDVIIGSIHWLDDEFVGQDEFLENYCQIEVENIYYKRMVDAINHGGFDVLGHLDFPKSYYGTNASQPYVMMNIIKLLIHKGIGLEINTASLRKGNRETMPSLSLVEAYIELGGNMLTIGSDAHFDHDIASGFRLLEEGLSDEAKACVGCFINRQFVRLVDIEPKIST